MRRWLAWLLMSAILSPLPACEREKIIIESPTSPSPPAPMGPVSLTVSPGLAGIVALTTFRFVASNFVPRGGSLRYSWDFGDGTTAETTGATADHVYQTAGTFAVRVFGVDSVAGIVDTAALSGLRVVNLSGSWAIRNPAGQKLIDRGISLTQDGALLRGDITPFGSCLVGVTGVITPEPAISLSFAMIRDGCAPRLALPLPSSFSGTGNATLDSFSGSIVGMGSVVISRCANNTTIVDCQ